jgi:hypothetical protein
MKTLSLCLPSQDTLWYSSLFKDGEQFVEVNTQESHPRSLTKTFKYYESNGHDATRIIANANKLAKKLFSPEVCQKYTIQLFENIAENRV